MKKIGLIALALILALGAMGVGFAHWQGTLDITGTVTAGSFGANLTQSNGVISSAIDNEMVGPESCTQYPPYDTWGDPLKTQNVGTASCSLSDLKPAGNPDGVMDTITITVTEAYPCYTVWVPMDVHCMGTVPIKVYYTVVSGSVPGELDVTLISDPAAAAGDKTLLGAIDAASAVKLHQSETARALIEIHGLQPGMVQGKQYTITMTLTYIQAQ